MKQTQLLTVQNIHHAIDETLSKLSITEPAREKGQEIITSFCCRRGCKEDTHAISNFCLPFFNADSSSIVSPALYPPTNFNIILEEKGCDHENDSTFVIKGVAIWYVGYSTWKGKVMNIDALHAVDSNAENMVMNALVNIAQSIKLNRIVYQVQGLEAAEAFREAYDAEVLHEWLTLQMGRNQILSFLTEHKPGDSELPLTNTISSSCNGNDATLYSDVIPLEIVHDAINIVLTKMNCVLSKKRTSDDNETFRLKRAQEKDAKSILKLVSGLALYEKALDEVHVDEMIYQVDGGGENPLYHCILVEYDTYGEGCNENCSPVVVGMGFFYFAHSIEKNGRYLFLEDLFIEEQYRGKGLGKSIMYVLASISKELGCERFVWQALDWNTPALNFYDMIGAEICKGLITLRLSKDKIMKFIT